jgi:hypothetical protein
VAVDLGTWAKLKKSKREREKERKWHIEELLNLYFTFVFFLWGYFDFGGDTPKISRFWRDTRIWW